VAPRWSMVRHDARRTRKRAKSFERYLKPISVDLIDHA
jgi:hypothetical protein